MTLETKDVVLPKREFDLMPTTDNSTLGFSHYHTSQQMAPYLQTVTVSRKLVLCLMNCPEADNDGMDSPSQTSLLPKPVLIRSSSSKLPKAWSACLVWNNYSNQNENN